jgi:hypothetical protein
MKTHLPHCDTVRDFSAENPRVSYAQGGRYLRVAFSRSPSMEWNQEQFYNWERKRGVCKGFSFGSRRRMLDRLNQLSVVADNPDFVTLTLPDESFEDDVASFAKTAKLHLDVLLKRLRRACPSACGFWRIEWKARKSGVCEGKLFPHFHLLVWGLPVRDSFVQPGQEESFVLVIEQQTEFAGLAANIASQYAFPSPNSLRNFRVRAALSHSRIQIGESFKSEQRWMSLYDWCSMAWYHVVGSHNQAHFLAGCRVEKIRTWGGVLSYCSKYMSKTDSENFLTDVAFGRSWGIFNRENMPWAKMIELPLADDVGVRLRRIAVRYLSHQLGRRVQRHYGITVYCDASRFARVLEPPPDTPF